MSDHVTDHVIDDLAALVAGDLSQDETRAVTAHLAACDECRRHLVTSVAGAASLRSAARHAPELFAELWDAPVAEPAPAPPEAVARPAARPRRRWIAATAAMAAAAIVIAVAVFAGTQLGDGGGATEAHAPLIKVGANSGSGNVTMRTRSGTTNMLVSTTDLPRLQPNTFYEVWLFDPHTGKMLAVGVLGPKGSGAYSLSQQLLEPLSGGGYQPAARRRQPRAQQGQCAARPLRRLTRGDRVSPEYLLFVLRLDP